MSKPQPAGFYDDIKDITESSLLFRLLLGINRLPDEDPDKKLWLEQLPSAVRKFVSDGHHDLEHHSADVKSRTLEILDSSPNILRASYAQGFRPIDLMAVITWSCALHDFTRFFGCNLAEHQLASASNRRA